jgi:RsmE family RNA methyltransferase
VNLLLVEPAELAADGTCALDGRRAQHLRGVLGAVAGSVVRAGIVGGAIGTAEVVSDDGETLVVRVAATGPPPPPLDVELVLAVPRPKVLTRVIEACAAFGVRRVDVTNAWRVDKSYLKSPRLAPDALAAAARRGAEQGATTHVPELHVHERLMALLDARYAVDRHARPSASLTGERCAILHPGAPPLAFAPRVIAIGPEGGWIERELDTFVARGFTPASLGPPILRVETALAAALGQLLLLSR